MPLSDIPSNMSETFCGVMIDMSKVSDTVNHNSIFQALQKFWALYQQVNYLYSRYNAVTCQFTDCILSCKK